MTSSTTKSSIYATLTLKLDNQHVVYDAALQKHYLKFDLLVSSTTGKFQINGIQQADIQIFNMNGLLLYSQKNITENSEIILDNLINGLYLVKIIEEDNIFNLRIIIEK